MKSQTLVIIPAYNEETVIGDVVRRVREQGFANIVVVDDGSRDRTSAVAEQNGAVVLRHRINRGPGAATQTGISYGVRNNFEYFLTIDGDGQHDPVDLNRVLGALNTHEVVIGSRFLSVNKIPFFRKCANKLGNFLTLLFFGILVTDSQSGLKGFRKNVAEQIQLLTSGYEFCSEFLQEIKRHRFSFTEVPISVTYSQYSQGKGQSFAKGIRTGLRLL